MTKIQRAVMERLLQWWSDTKEPAPPSVFHEFTHQQVNLALHFLHERGYVHKLYRQSAVKRPPVSVYTPIKDLDGNRLEDEYKLVNGVKVYPPKYADGFGFDQRLFN